MRSLAALFLAAAMALPVAAGAQDAAQPTITVTGSGTVTVAPDMATLTIGVTTQGDTAAAALTANNTALDAVMERLTGAGIEARDIQTSNLSLNPNWTAYDGKSPTIMGYTAANMVTVRVRKLDGLGAVLDAAVADGANTLNGLVFGLADPRPAQDDARQAAVADAREKAQLLASAAGVTLGRVLSIYEGSPPMDPMPMFRAMDEAGGVPLAGGEVGMTETVTILYEIVQ